jgi:tetratricopeptide (TPR) repeat protein
MKRLLANGYWLLAIGGCASRPANLVVVTSSVAQTVSLLGDTLYGLPLDPAGGPARVRRIVAAREELARDSSNLAAWLHLGRSTAGMGRLRDAVAIYSRIVEVYFTDPRAFRERGELLLRLRRLDAAIADFQKAGLLMLPTGRLLEPIRLGAESDGSAAPRLEVTTTQYQNFFLLGIAQYCKGDNLAAYKVLAEAAGIALTADDLARALLWLFFALRRVGNGGEARRALELVQPDWSAESSIPEIKLLRAYKGQVPTDSIQAEAMGAPGEERALYSYGIAYHLLLKPGREADAELWLERALSGPDWSQLVYVVAEADLARLRKR